MPVEMDPARFEALVDRALDGIPDELAAAGAQRRGAGRAGGAGGRPRPARAVRRRGAHRADGDYAGMLPDRIFIFRGPLLDMCETEEELVEEVRITVVHEVAHHFGIDDGRLHELGCA